MRKSRKDAERKKSRMSGEHKRGGAADAAGSSRATGLGGNRFSKSTHGPPASARGAQPAGRGRGGGSMRGSKAGMAVCAPPAQSSHCECCLVRACVSCPCSIRLCKCICTVLLYACSLQRPLWHVVVQVALRRCTCCVAGVGHRQVYHSWCS